MKRLAIAASLVACGQDKPREVAPVTPVTPVTPTDATTATATPTSAGFVVHHAGDGFGGEPTTDDPGGAWPAFLAAAPLDRVIVADADIEAVGLAPLRLVLTPASARRFTGDARKLVGESRFVATLDGARLYAGRVMFIGTARALHHPIVHVMDNGLATSLWIVPRIGDHRHSDVVATPAIVDHFKRTGRLVESGTPFGRIFARRRWVAQAAAGKPGEPATRITGECTGTSCTLSFAFRQTANDTWSDRGSRPIDVADFDPVWLEVERDNLVQIQPRDGRDAAVIHPPTLRYAIAAERGDGTTVEADRSWVSAAVDDRQAARFFDAAVALATRHGFEPRYFRTPDN